MDRFLNTNEIDTATATCVDQIYELTQVNVETFKQNLSKIEEAKNALEMIRCISTSNSILLNNSFHFTPMNTSYLCGMVPSNR